MKNENIIAGIFAIYVVLSSIIWTTTLHNVKENYYTFADKCGEKVEDKPITYYIEKTVYHYCVESNRTIIKEIYPKNGYEPGIVYYEIEWRCEADIDKL